MPCFIGPQRSAVYIVPPSAGHSVRTVAPSGARRSGAALALTMAQGLPQEWIDHPANNQHDSAADTPLARGPGVVP